MYSGSHPGMYPMAPMLGRVPLVDPIPFPGSSGSQPRIPLPSFHDLDTPVHPPPSFWRPVPPSSFNLDPSGMPARHQFGDMLPPYGRSDHSRMYPDPGGRDDSDRRDAAAGDDIQSEASSSPPPGRSPITGSPGRQDSDSPEKKYPDYCQTLVVKDASGHVKELVFPKALDLDRPKRARTTFSPDQLYTLEAEFQMNQYLVGRERTELAQRLHLSETQVKVWFQNRRTKYKRDKSRDAETKMANAEGMAACSILRMLQDRNPLGGTTGSVPNGTAIQQSGSSPIAVSMATPNTAPIMHPVTGQRSPDSSSYAKPPYRT